MRFDREEAGSRQWAVGRNQLLASSLQPLALPRSGMTLIELLVVIVLVTTLVSTAIPIISPGGDSKRLREASRNLNAYLQGAQARAIETGRPFGVAFHRLSADTDRGADNAVCVRAEYVEVPPHYSGPDTSSLARICINNNYPRQLSLQFIRYGNTTPPTSDGLPAGYDTDLVPDAFIRPGDHVFVGAHEYRILPYTTNIFSQGLPYARTYSTNQPGAGYFIGTRPDQQQNPEGGRVGVFGLQLVDSQTAPAVTHRISGPNAQSNVEEVTPSLQAIPGNGFYFATAPAPFKLIRQPIPAGGEPLEMPGSVAIDLQASLFTNGVRVFQPASVGFDTAKNDFVAQSAPVMLLFSPQGNVERYYSGIFVNGEPQSSSVTSTLALCVGRRELIPPKQTEGAAALANSQGYNEPINLQRDIVDRNLSETEAKQVMDQYNWLNLDSRWVLVGGQSGAVSTIANSAVYPSAATASVDMQLAVATQNAKTRTTAGGR